jgi:hypothetical protein
LEGWKVEAGQLSSRSDWAIEQDYLQKKEKRKEKIRERVLLHFCARHCKGKVYRY